MDPNALHIFIIDDAEFVIARDEQDARAVYRETHGEDTPEIDSVEPWPDRHPFSFDHQDARGVETLPGIEWAAKHGRGWFASENY